MNNISLSLGQLGHQGTEVSWKYPRVFSYVHGQNKYKNTKVYFLIRIRHTKLISGSEYKHIFLEHLEYIEYTFV